MKKSETLYMPYINISAQDSCVKTTTAEEIGLLLISISLLSIDGKK